MSFFFFRRRLIVQLLVVSLIISGLLKLLPIFNAEPKQVMMLVDTEHKEVKIKLSFFLTQSNVKVLDN